MPTTPSPPDLVTTLVVANRILYRHGVVDGFGHVSARDPGAPGRFLLSRSLAPGQVTPADVMSFDLDGNPQNGDARQPYLERFIHGEIYRARPDVGSIVHSHSPSVIPFGATRRALKPLYHMSSFIGEGSAIFEIREAGGDTDMLIRDRPLGAALARSLGDRTVVLMRGHGSTVVGASIEEAVFRAIYTEMNARLQMQALALGEPVYLNAEEAARSTRTNQGVLRRAWDLWAGDVGPLV
ncbi:MAG: class II aldolase/adducin family protein [Casimicrobiaceae bacterium]